ncbi:DegV family protein [Clostridium paraputrificum]|uniref:DegV family protein n=1 Tax=Clostridium paraputrificum TaxID=29363 RepID=UPI000665E6F9|nr:DegV family protein [Clostridium paraputrificum]MDB2107099.1 DegV family protein [Clostridium paraputrificum]MDB2113656.1 DegV family protein [Clostridium paraputrificum]
MKNKIAIVTDTNSGITQEEAKKLGIYLIAMPFFINDNTYYEGITLSQEEFFKKLEADENISTSQPSPGTVIELWDNLLKDYDYILHIPMSSGLSNSMETARMLSSDYEGKVLVVDNKRISVTFRQSILDALYLIEKGLSAKEIQEILEKEALESIIYVTVDTLKYLEKGGRITPAVAALGSMFNIKPVLLIDGGKLDTYKKVRGLKSAQKAMIEAIKNDIENRFKGTDYLIQTAYSGDLEQGKKWNETVKQAFPEHDVYNDVLPMSICCHVGPGALGITCVKKISL